MWASIIQLFFGVGLAALPALIRKIFFTLGVGFITFSGAQALLTVIQNYIISAFGGLQVVPIAAQIVGVLNIDLAVTNILSALATRLAWDFIKGKYLTWGNPTIS